MQVSDFEVPASLRYHGEHFWVRQEGEELVVGWTDFAQQTAGDVAFVELNPLGNQVETDGHFGTLETGKWVGKLICPVTGIISAINESLANAPQQINQDPYGNGWLIKVKPRSPGALDHLMDEGAYKSHLQTSIDEMD